MSDIPLTRPSTPLLDQVNQPQDTHAFSPQQLDLLADELRQYLLYSVGQSGGHFGAGLGVVELSVALHHVFNSPKDSLVWDVGHQAYPHKILTGRREELLRIRHSDGPAPFPTRDESVHDSFGVGHSGTSISAALGMALAKQATGDTSHTIAIIGDGGLTAGMAFEALNHAGACKPNLLIVLNDNAMSISHNVGALAGSFANFFSSNFYTSARKLVKKTLKPMPQLADIMRQFESHTKGLVIPPSTIFEALNCQYFGPADGHNLNELLDLLTNIKAIEGISVLHLRTMKGKGFIKAEHDPIGYHALEKISAIGQSESIAKPKFSQVFGRWLCATAAKDERLHAITPAMCEGSGMTEFAKLFAQRHHDVGIAEQHAVTFAAGMACKQIKPVVAIYSTFLQRAYDQLIHDVCLQNIDVTFALDRAGLVGEDGPTHHGAFDLAYLRCIPNLTIAVPSDEAEQYRMLTTAYLHPGPALVRFARGSGPGVTIPDTLIQCDTRAKTIRQGDTKKPALLVFGPLLHSLGAMAEQHNLTLVDMRYLKPLDTLALKTLAQSYRHIAVVEDNAIIGGAGSAVLEALNQIDWQGKLSRFGIPDRFIPHGSRSEQLMWSKLTPEEIAKALFGK